MPRVSDDDLDSIVGAFWAPDVEMFRVLLRATGKRLGGDLAELGVLYGRSAVLLGDHLGPGETLTVVDLFGSDAAEGANQEENESSYPGLTRGAFEDNYRRLLGDLPVVVQGLSHTIADHAAAGAHRLVHVDASHLYQHVATDIDVARSLLKRDGVLVLDDFRTEHAPGVAAAAWQAVLTSDLKPFALSPFKMYATWGDPAPWQGALEDWAVGSAQQPDVQVVNGHSLLRFTAPRPAAPHPLKRWVPEAVWPLAQHLRPGGRR